MRWWRPVPDRTAAVPGRDGGTAGAHLARAAPPALTRSWHPLKGWAEMIRAPLWRDRRAGLSNASTPRSARPRGARHRSAGDLEAGLLDLAEEIAGEAGLDAQRASDPLPRLGHDVLVEPLAPRIVQRSDQKDRAVIGYAE